ncbi:MAG: hypothetical protein ACON4Z_16110, partial [Planctomycetota bacterium]
MTSISELSSLARDELLAKAAGRGLGLPPHLGHDELVAAVALDLLAGGDELRAEGELSTLFDGFGFVRQARHDYAEAATDVYVSPRQIRALRLQHGHRVRGRVRAPRGEEKFLTLLEVESVQGAPVAEVGDVAPFAALEVEPASRPLSLAGDAALEALLQPAPWRLGHRVLVHVSAAFRAAAWLRGVAD